MEKRRGLTFRKVFLIVILAIFVLCMGLAGVSALINRGLAQHLPVEEHLTAADKARIAEAVHLRQYLGEQIMPGYGKADIPVIVYNEQYAFLVGLENPAVGWLKIPTRNQRGAAWEPVLDDDFLGQPYFRQRLPDPKTNPQAFTVLVGDRWTASIGNLEWMKLSLAAGLREMMPEVIRSVFPYSFYVGLLLPNSDIYVVMLNHEAMHAYQGTRNSRQLDAAEQLASQGFSDYPYENQAFTSDWQAELNLLNEAIRAKTDDQARELAVKFLQQRASRRQKAGLSAGLVDFERLKEWEEGIAKYTELSAYRLASTTAEYRPVDALGRDAQFNEYKGFQQKWDQEVQQIRLSASADEDKRFYYSGFVQAVLLDRLLPGWKDRLFEDGVWLEDLLSEAVE